LVLNIVYVIRPFLL